MTLQALGTFSLYVSDASINLESLRSELYVYLKLPHRIWILDLSIDTLILSERDNLSRTIARLSYITAGVAVSGPYEFSSSNSIIEIESISFSLEHVDPDHIGAIVNRRQKGPRGTFRPKIGLKSDTDNILKERFSCISFR